MISARWSHVLVVLTAASVLQTGIFDQLLILDRVRIDLLVMVLLGVGLTADPRSAAVLGFFTGLSVDFFRSGPFGMHALLFLFAGWLLGMTRDRMLLADGSFRTVQGAVAASSITAATWIGAAVFGQTPPPFNTQTLVDLLWIGLVGAVLVHPADRVAQWMLFRRPGRTPRTDLARSE